MSVKNHSDNRWTPSQQGRSAWFSDHTAGGYSILTIQEWTLLQLPQNFKTSDTFIIFM